MEFWKMHGAGNDFIIADNRENQFAGNLPEKSKLAKSMCHRHFGIGADGMIFAEKSSICSIKMSFFNADGSEATMCGNGIRCFAKYIYDKGISPETEFDIETGDGAKRVKIIESRQDLSTVRVEMGKWDNNLIEFDLHVFDQTLTVSFLHMGVPHAVYFMDDRHGSDVSLREDFILKFGPAIEKNPIFKEGTNVNFVQILDNQRIRVDTWERGAGRTLACGTGASASVIVASRLKGLHNELDAEMPGGTVKITLLEDDGVFMEGPARTICKGTYLL